MLRPKIVNVPGSALGGVVVYEDDGVPAPVVAQAKPAPNAEAEQEKNRQLAKDKMDAFFNEAKGRFIGSVEKASARNPAIKPEVFKAIADEFGRMQPAMEADYLQAFKISANPAQLKQELDKLQSKYTKVLHDKIVKDYGDDGTKALEAVGSEMQPEAITTPVIKTVYNSENGGPQWGGIIGAGAGGIATFFLTTQLGGLSPFWGVIASLAAAAVGAFAGSYFNPAPKPLATPDFHSQDKPKEKAPAKVRELGDDTQLTEKDKDKPANPDFKKIMETTKVALDTPDARAMNIKTDSALTAGPGRT